MRTVRKRPGQPLMSRLADSRVGRILLRRSVAPGKPIITPYHQQIGQAENRIEPSLNDRPFYEFWKPCSGHKNFTDTVDHQVMEVRELKGKPGSVRGVWHLKSPGSESPGEKRKRKFQKVVYRLLNQDYKGKYYDDLKLLVQKEVLATNIYRAVVLASYRPDQNFAGEFQCGYSFDETRGRHCVAIKHLDGFENASTLFSPNVEGPEWRIFDERHNPATNLVIRRFFLGDEDYLKLDNYMVRQNQGRRGRTRMYCIDLGMAFYNMFRLPRRCTVNQFRKKLLGKSRKHRVQYHRKPTIHTVLEQMGPKQVERGIQSGLKKVASLEDGVLERLLWHIHDPGVRESLFTLLKHRRDQARAILWPERHPWPAELPTKVSAGLVRQDRHS